MSQNRSHAVMAQRQMALEAEEYEDFPGQAELDDFPTQPWAGRALIRHLTKVWELPPMHFNSLICWEPAANRRYLSGALAESFSTVFCSDIYDYGFNMLRHDFLSSALPQRLIERPDWIITNPPFNQGCEFVERALEIAHEGVAMFVRTSFLESDTRYQALYANRAPTLIAQFVERVPLLKGRCNNRVIDPKTGEEKAASSATSYAWIIWRRQFPPSEEHAVNPWQFGRGMSPFSWIAPCRAELERPAEDYRGEPARAAKRAPREDFRP